MAAARLLALLVGGLVPLAQLCGAITSDSVS